MTKFLFFLLSVLGCLAFALSADCEFKGKQLKSGETYQPPGECALYSCDKPGAISGKTCPDVQSLKPCKYIPSDPSKSYPQCCASFDC